MGLSPSSRQDQADIAPNQPCVPASTAQSISRSQEHLTLPGTSHTPSIRTRAQPSHNEPAFNKLNFSPCLLLKLVGSGAVGRIMLSKIPVLSKNLSLP